MVTVFFVCDHGAPESYVYHEPFSNEVTIYREDHDISPFIARRVLFILVNYDAAAGKNRTSRFGIKIGRGTRIQRALPPHQTLIFQTSLMKTLFSLLSIVILIIVVFVFAAGVFITGLGIYDFTHAFHFFGRSDEHGSVQIATLSLLKAVDLFLLAIVLFVFSFGLRVLFNNKTEQALPPNLPAWLKVKNFVELKVILWEAVLTTLVISYLAYLAELRIEGRPITIQDLTVPGAILLISVSLFFLKKGEH